MPLTAASHAVMGWVKQGRHPYGPMTAARGIHIWDRSGRKFVDLCSGQFNVNVGYAHPRVVSAIKEQADRFSYIPPVFETEIKEELARRIADVAPDPLAHVFFTNSGAEAIEAAIKVARTVTGRHKIYSAWKGYHGATAGASAVSGDPRRLYVEPSMPSVGKFHYPTCYGCPLGLGDPTSCGTACLTSLRNQLEYDGPHTVAGILVEPIVGGSGLYVPPVEFIQGLRRICDELGIALIFDETITAWCRTGKWFAMEHFGITPDLVATAKGITSGYVPLGAMIMTRDYYEAFRERPFVSGSTTEGHALACAAAIANMDVYAEEGLLENAATLGTYLRGRLEDFAKEHPIIGDIRSRGLFSCMEMNMQVAAPSSPATGEAKLQLGAEIAQRLYDVDIFAIVRGSILFVAPPLTTTIAELDESLDKVDRVLASLEAERALVSA